MVFLHPLVDEAEPAHDVTALVGQERVRDAVDRGEIVQDPDRIVADREEGDPVRRRLRSDLLQLNQLRLAERSPLGAAVKDDKRLAPGASRVQVHRCAGLVRQADVGKGLPFFRPNRPEVPRR